MFGNFLKIHFLKHYFLLQQKKYIFPLNFRLIFLSTPLPKPTEMFHFIKILHLLKLNGCFFLNSKITYTEFISLTRSPFSNKFLEWFQFSVQYQIFVLWYAHLLVCNIVGNAALQVISKLVFQLPDGHVFTNCIRNSFFMPSTFLCYFNLLVSVYLYICSIGL